MVFSSFTFLFVFLPFFFCLYYLAWVYSSSEKVFWPNCAALVGSYCFYAWGAPQVIPILIGSTFLDYCISKQLTDSSKTKFKHCWLAVGIGVNFSVLVYYKYASFFLAQFHWLLGQLPEEEYSSIYLIGISFFTLQKISYLIDVWRGDASPSRSFIEYALYVSLFPQLIAGPIVRYKEVSEQLSHRTLSKESDLIYGIWRFSLGLGKKVLIADQLGLVAGHVFEMSPARVTTPLCWLGMLAYTFQIYFDFSGYSDMAIGLGRLMGFTFPENFRSPYISRSFTEFWRRWHITLSSWFRDYLYVPLGGNRVSVVRNYFNLWIVFLVSGLWHGASWNFILWGAFHGAMLTWEKRNSRDVKTLYCLLLTFFLVMHSWVLFRADSLSDALFFYGRMWMISQPTAPMLKYHADIIHSRGWVALLLAAFISFSPAILEYIDRCIERRPVYRTGFAMLLLFLSVTALAGSSFSPFLYYKF